MKKLMALALFAAAFTAVQAAATFRVDVNGIKTKVAFTINQGSDMKGAPQGWVKTNKECTITYSSSKKANSTEWKNYTISFVPKTSGVIQISVAGEWAPKPEGREWLLVSKITLNNALYANGDFKKTFKTKTGQVMPAGFWLSSPKCKYFPTAGKDGAPAFLVNHDNRLAFDIKVEAGKKYEFGFEAKAATPEQSK